MAKSSKAKTDTTGMAGKSSKVLRAAQHQQQGITPESQDWKVFQEKGPSYYPWFLPDFLEEHLSFFEADVVKRLIRMGRAGRSYEEDQNKIIRSINLIGKYRTKEDKFKLKISYLQFRLDSETWSNYKQLSSDIGLTTYNWYATDDFIDVLCSDHPDVLLKEFSDRVQNMHL